MVSTLPAAVAPSTRQLLRAYLEAISLAEPIQQRLWSDARLTLTQLRVLGRLRHGPLTINQIARAVGQPPPSMTRILDRLEERRLVSRRRRTEDRRCVEVNLEPAGQRLVAQVRPLRGSVIEAAIDAMEEEERLRLAQALEDLVRRARVLTEAEEEVGAPR
ncbi:MAG: MarR family winged helix-turn-helix transcriptional regulator [Candidatus Dormibacteraceae bacterium]